MLKRSARYASAIVIYFLSFGGVKYFTQGQEMGDFELAATFFLVGFLPLLVLYFGVGASDIDIPSDPEIR